MYCVGWPSGNVPLSTGSKANAPCYVWVSLRSTIAYDRACGIIRTYQVPFTARFIEIGAMPLPSHHEHFERVRQDHQRELVEDYVEEIAWLHEHVGEARASDLAERFGVSPAAVSKVVTRLKRDGLVNARPYRGIFLTEEGVDMARHVAERHEIVMTLLRTLGVSEDIARADSEGIEHHCSEETVAAMQRFLAKHGPRSTQ